MAIRFAVEGGRTVAAGLFIAAGLMICGPGGTALAQPAARPTARAALPTFADGQMAGVFFEDVASEALVGDRPANLGTTVVAAAASPGGTGPMATAPGGDDAAGETGWEAAVSGTVLEDEIKRINLHLGEAITTPTDFAGKGYRVTRLEFSILAGVFGVIAEYPGDVRFKDQAAAARDHFARAAAGSKVGTPQAYDQAKRARQDLADLVGGSGASFDPPAEDVDWSMIIDRTPIMERLDQALNATILPATSNEAAFKEDPEKLDHEAQMIAALSAMLAHPQMPDADAEDYAGWTGKMKASARGIVDAIKLNNYDQARTSAGELSKQCDSCHEVYR